MKWQLVSEPGDFWYDVVYRDNDTGEVSRDPGKNKTPLTLTMFGIGFVSDVHGRQYYNIYADMHFSYRDTEEKYNITTYSYVNYGYYSYSRLSAVDINLDQLNNDNVSASLFNKVGLARAPGGAARTPTTWFSSFANKLIVELSKGIQKHQDYDVTNFTAFYQENNYTVSLADYLKWHMQQDIYSHDMQAAESLKEGTLDLHNTNVTEACLVKVVKDVPLDGYTDTDTEHDIKPVTVIDLSDNDSITKGTIVALLKALAEEDKGKSLVLIDVRDTSISAEEGVKLMEDEAVLGEYQALGHTILIHEGNREDYDSWEAGEIDLEDMK